MSENRKSRRVHPDAFGRIKRWSCRKPVFATMGENGVGKSVLVDLLTGLGAVPEQFLTQSLPPIWLKYGDEAPYRIDHDGQRHEVDLNALDQIPMSSTRFLHIFVEADILAVCDLIDTPGVAAGNITAEAWRRVVGHANGVLWCTPAPQAWSDREQGIWMSMPDRIMENSLLLVTEADQMPSQGDCIALMDRIEQEAGDYFDGMHMMSLQRAISAGDDRAQWTASGAEYFVSAFFQLIDKVNDARKSRLSEYIVDETVKGSSRPGAQPISPRRIRPSGTIDWLGLEAGGEVPVVKIPTSHAGDGQRKVAQRISAADALRAALGGVPRPTVVVEQNRTTDCQSNGAATRTWMEIAKTVDMSSPDQILSAVERLLKRLDTEMERSDSYRSAGSDGLPINPQSLRQM